jgi:hypothetical protein
MALQKKGSLRVKDIKPASVLPSISKDDIRKSLIRMKRKETKSNVSIPLGPSMLKRWTILSEKYGIARSELMRIGLEYLLADEDGFLEMLEDTNTIQPDSGDED